MATGGSTNAVLHFLAIAHAAEVEWTIDDFERVRKKTPVLCDLKPAASTWRWICTRRGIPQVMKVLLKAACCMVTASPSRPDHCRGAQRHSGSAACRPGRDPPIAKPMYKEGHLAILKGNLSPEVPSPRSPDWKNPVITAGAVCSTTSSPPWRHSWRQDQGRRRDGAALLGPKGGPGMPEMLAPPRAGSVPVWRKRGLITDAVSQAAPGAWWSATWHRKRLRAATIAFVNEGDSITIDAHLLKLELNVPEAEISKRRAAGRHQPALHAWRAGKLPSTHPPPARVRSGQFTKTRGCSFGKRPSPKRPGRFSCPAELSGAFSRYPWRHGSSRFGPVAFVFALHRLALRIAGGIRQAHHATARPNGRNTISQLQAATAQFQILQNQQNDTYTRKYIPNPQC